MSVLFTVLKMDAGPVLRQVKRPLQGDEKVRSDDLRDKKKKKDQPRLTDSSILMCESITQAPELLQELFEAGTAALVEALPSVWDGTAA